jgi:hypothetical protein
LLFLVDRGPGRLECRGNDGGAARMADDCMLAPLIADQAGAVRAAEQGRQGDA